MRPVVLITVDCLRADHLGCYGYERPTSPNVDRFAEGATVFEHSYANCPGTRWAFQSLHTGVSSLHVDGLGIPEGYAPVARQFSDAGFETGGFAVNGFVSRDYRYDEGFDHFYSVEDTQGERGLVGRVGSWVDDAVDSELVKEYVLRPAHDWLQSAGTDENNRFQPAHSDADTVDRAVTFVEERGDRPFFLWVHLMDAHTPYGYWPEHLRALRGDADLEHTIHPGKEGKVEHGREPPREVIDTYDAGIRSADEQIDRLVDAVPDDATVVVTGDHGEEFGQYGDFHNRSLYSSMTQVPIVVRSPDLEAGRSRTPAQHLDIPPTLLHAAGIEVPDHWEGSPLQTLDRDADAPVFFGFDAEELGVRAGEWKYVESPDGAALYRVPHHGAEGDPVEEAERLAELRTTLREYESEQTVGTGRSKLRGDDDLSEDVEENLEDLGYL